MLNRFRVFALSAGIATSILLAGVLRADTPPAEPAGEPVAAEASPNPADDSTSVDVNPVPLSETPNHGGTTQVDLPEAADGAPPASKQPPLEPPTTGSPPPIPSVPMPPDPAATPPAPEVPTAEPSSDVLPATPLPGVSAEEPPLPTANPDVEAPDQVDQDYDSRPSTGSADDADDDYEDDPGPRMLRFNFRFQPWADVLEWFAEEAGYSLLLDAPPSGTFNYTDKRDYTPAEALDLINSVLLTKGYTLVIRDRMLMVVNLEDEVPPALVTRIPVENLDEHGKYELLSTRFQLRSLSAEQGRAEIEDLLGPQGDVVMLPQARQLIVTETGGKLREIRDVLERAEAVGDPSKQELKWFELKSVSPDEAAAVLRQIFEIPEGGNATADGSMRMATDPIGLRLLISGTPERLEQVTKMLQTIDQPAFGEPAEAAQQAALQVEVYDIAPADPESVLRVTQTLLAESPGVRLAIDPKTGYLIALARPTEHATIRATIDQMRKDAQGVEVLQLRVLDPQIAVLAIGKLFGTDPQKAPSVDADISNRQLLIRGSAGQIAEVRSLLAKMGETFGSAPGMAGGKLRLLPMDDRSAEELVERLEALWPALGSNELRFIRGGGGPTGGDSPPRMIDERTPVPGERREEPAPRFPDSRPGDSQQRSPVKTESGKRRVVRLASLQSDEDSVEAPPVPDPTAANPHPPTPEIVPQIESTPSLSGANTAAPENSPIFILAGPQGLVISSEDIEALDRLQGLIDTLQGDVSADSGEPKLTVFYLRHAQAQAVAERLTQLFAGAAPTATTSTPAPAQGGRGEPAAPSGIMGTLGAGGTVGRLTPKGPVSITPDQRLNALLVQAAPSDIDMVERILQILDRPGSPEDVPAEPKPRLIPVVHMAASDVAEVIKEVYKDRLSTGNTRGGSPAEQMMAMFRGRRGEDGGPPGQMPPGAAATKDTTPKLSVGVDTRTNSLIVLAPEPLFEEVRELVASLDQVAADDVETVEVVRLSESNVESVRDTLSTLLGDSIESSSSSSNRRSSRSGSGNSPWGGGGRGGFPGGFSPFGGGGGFFGRGR